MKIQTYQSKKNVDYRLDLLELACLDEIEGDSLRLIALTAADISLLRLHRTYIMNINRLYTKVWILFVGSESIVRGGDDGFLK